MSPAGDYQAAAPAVRLWWRSFDRASRHRWPTTLFLTALAGGLLWMAGSAWVLLVLGSDETAGYVLRDRSTVRYEVDGRLYTARLGWARSDGFCLWGDPVKVQYLPAAPWVSRCPNTEEHEWLATLLMVFVAFVVAPLVWLWWTNVIRPAFQAFRMPRSGQTGRTTPEGMTTQMDGG
jgi:hypothetical protein